MLSGSTTWEEYVSNWGQNKPSPFQTDYDPEWLSILGRTIQIDVTEMTRTKDFTFMGTFQKVTVNELIQLGAQAWFSFSLQPLFWQGRQ